MVSGFYVRHWYKDPGFNKSPTDQAKFTPEPGLDRFVTACGRLVTKLLSLKGIAAIKEA